MGYFNSATDGLQRVTLWVAASEILPIQFKTILEYLDPLSHVMLFREILSDEPKIYWNNNRGIESLLDSIQRGYIHRIIMSSPHPVNSIFRLGSLVAEFNDNEAGYSLDQISIILSYEPSGESTRSLREFIRLSWRIIQLLNPLCAFISDKLNESIHQTRVEQKYAKSRPLRSNILLRGHRGAFWVTFLGSEQCEALGGVNAVVENAPAQIVRPVGNGMWLQLSETPPATEEALISLETYLHPLFSWMSSPHPAGLDQESTDELIGHTSRVSSPAVGIPNTPQIERRPEQRTRRKCTVPYRINMHEDTENVLNIHLSLEPDQTQRSLIQEIVTLWALESARFDTQPGGRGFHEMSDPKVSGRVMRWVIGFGSVDERRAVRRLSRLLADAEGVGIERIFVGMERAR